MDEFDLLRRDHVGIYKGKCSFTKLKLFDGDNRNMDKQDQLDRIYLGFQNVFAKVPKDRIE